MKRREFIGLVGGATVWPIAAVAQQAGRVPLVVLWLTSVASDPVGQRNAAIFRDTFSSLGWVDGRNVRIELRWNAASITTEQVRAAAAEVTALNPDVIVTTGAPMLGALKNETRTIPIVFTLVTDPVSEGFVSSLARPGGYVTGFTIFEHSFAGKWLEMLKEAVPSMTRVAVMQNPDHPAWHAYLRAISTIASAAGVEVIPTPVNGAVEIEAALEKFAGTPNGGLVVLPSPIGTVHRQVIADAALRYRLPSIYGYRFYPEAGGFMSYGVVITEPYRQAATYVDRILKGTKPGELPVQAATEFEMVLNLKTAKKLGITVPPTMLGRADEVIE
jgi:putative tryptophan/tyrosine transport system substrate-binding protein